MKAIAKAKDWLRRVWQEEERKTFDMRSAYTEGFEDGIGFVEKNIGSCKDCKYMEKEFGSASGKCAEVGVDIGYLDFYCGCFERREDGKAQCRR